MAKKTINLIIVRADRQEWDGGSTNFLVTDLNHAPIKILQKLPLKPQSHNVNLELGDDVPFDAGQLYGLTLDATGHRTTYQLVNRQNFLRDGVEHDDVIVKMMLVPKDPKSSDLAGGYGHLRDNNSPIAADKTGLTEQQYGALEPAAKKMALLNLEAKLRDTKVNGASLLSFVEGVRYVAVDRIFLFVRADLKGMIQASHSEFKPAQGHNAPSAEEAPPELHLPAHKDSWKHTRFDTGNVQLSFSQVAEPLPNTTKSVFSLEADIDLEKGIGHVLEFLENKITKGKTDQTQVYSLLFPQGITPYYTLDPLLG